MAATRKEIERWFDEGVKQSATHMIVSCDTFDFEDYPVYVLANQDIMDRIKHYQSAHMTKVMEVYNLSKDKDPQLDAMRAWNL